MKTPLRVGVIGVGTLGCRHAENVASLRDTAELVGVADPDRAAAEHLAHRLGTRAFVDGEALMDEAGVQAVIIATPAETHVALVNQAATRAIHVLCEKPLGVCVEEAAQAVEAADLAGISLQVGFMRRYDPAYSDAHRAVERGDIGSPVLLTAISRDREPPARSYFTSPGAANPLIESAGHDFDLVRWLLRSEVRQVWAAGSTLSCHDVTDVQPFDAAVVTLWLESGALASVQVYKNAVYGYDIRSEIVGTEGTIFVGPSPNKPMSTLTATSNSGLPMHWLERFGEAYRLEVEDWMERILDGRPPLVTGEDGLRAVAISEAADRSRLSGDIITL